MQSISLKDLKRIRILRKILGPFWLSNLNLFLAFVMLLSVSFASQVIGDSIISKLQKLKAGTLKLFREIALIRDMDMVLITRSELEKLRSYLKGEVCVHPIIVKRLGDENFVVAGIPQLLVLISPSGAKALLEKVGVPEGIRDQVKGDVILLGNKFPLRSLGKHKGSVIRLPLTETPLDNIALKVVPDTYLNAQEVYTYALVIPSSDKIFRRMRANLQLMNLKLIDLNQVRDALERANRTWASTLSLLSLNLNLLLLVIAVLLSQLLASARTDELKYLSIMGGEALGIFNIGIDIFRVFIASVSLSIPISYIALSYISHSLNFPNLEIPSKWIIYVLGTWLALTGISILVTVRGIRE